MRFDRRQFREIVKVWCHILLDVAVLLLLLALFLVLYIVQQLYGLVHREGFFCDDASIHHPYVGESVPGWVLPVVSIVASLIVVLVGNLVDHVTLVLRKRGHRSFRPFGKDSHFCPLPPWIARTGNHLKWYHIGLLLTAIVAWIGKSVVGSLRPHFLATCQPLFETINCSDSYGQPRYVTDYVCTGDPVDVVDGRMSWPSTHAAVTSYDFVFLALYISGVRVFHHRSAFKLALMVLFFLVSLVISMTSVTDHRNHPIDIVSGWAIGVCIAVILVYYNLHYFDSEHRRKVSWLERDSSEMEPLTSTN